MIHHQNLTLGLVPKSDSALLAPYEVWKDSSNLNSLMDQNENMISLEKERYN